MFCVKRTGLNNRLVEKPRSPAIVRNSVSKIVALLADRRLMDQRVETWSVHGVEHHYYPSTCRVERRGYRLAAIAPGKSLLEIWFPLQRGPCPTVVLRNSGAPE